MSARVFVVSDTHFGHKKIIQFEAEKRPFFSIEEHDEELVYRWNNVVRPQDTVWHLGDVLFGAKSFEHLPRLNGKKRLVLGNHDQFAVEKYLEHFVEIAGAVNYRGCLFTHVPVHPGQFYRFRGNVHGHTHSSSLPDPRYIPVSIEHTELAPVLLDKVLAKLPMEVHHG